MLWLLRGRSFEWKVGQSNVIGDAVGASAGTTLS
jgi:hypothetical protein